MPLDFSTYLSSARQFSKAQPANAQDEHAVVLNGRQVAIVPAGEEKGLAEIVQAKHDFIESFVRQFGEGMRPTLAKLLNPEDAKPLTARTILAANEIASEATAGEMSKRLDSLLLKAAERGMTAVSQADLQSIASQYGNDEKTQAFFASLETTRKKADEAMAKLVLFTGREIAAAMRGNGPALPGDPDQGRVAEVRETLKAAIESFTSLGDMLRKLYNAGGGEPAGVDTLAVRCYARATEIERLAIELGNLGRNAADAPRLNAFARTLLPQTAVQMHGTEAALDALQRQLRPVAERLDAIKASAKQGGSANWLEVKTLRDELKVARDALKNAAENGITYPGSDDAFRPEPGILNALSGLLDQIEQDIRATVEDLALISGKNYLDETCPKLSNFALFSRFRDLLGLLGSKTAVDNMERIFDTIRRLSLAWLQSMADAALFSSLNSALNAKLLTERAQKNSIRLLLRNLRILDKALSGKPLANNEKQLLPADALAAVNALQEKEKDELRAALREAVDEGALLALESADKTVPLLAKRLSLIEQATQRKPAPSLANDALLLRAFNGELDFATVAGARGWGATEEMIDLDISDANLVSKKPLGSGNANETFLCTYKLPDGTTKQYVFKPEMDSGLSLHNVSVGGKEGYDAMQSVVHLNAASRKAAGLLGAKGVIVAAKAGSVRGKFGLFMELAQGVTLADVGDAVSTAGKVPSLKAKLYARLGRLSPDYVASLPAEKYRVLAGNYLREGLSLEWADWLSGQTDRHWGNYMIHVGEDLSVQIKGIDNDFSFPEWRLGMTRFRAEGSHLQSFLAATGRRDAADAARLPGVSLAPDGKSLEIDLSKNWELSEAVRNVFGVQVVTFPSAISEEMYGKLMELDSDRTKLRAELGPHVSEKAIQAAEQRLDEMVAHAKRLAEKGLVLKKDDWFDPERQKDVVRGQRPRLTDASGRRMKREFYHEGIFVRDFNTVFRRGIE